MATVNKAVDNRVGMVKAATGRGVAARIPPIRTRRRSLDSLRISRGAVNPTREDRQADVQDGAIRGKVDDPDGEEGAMANPVLAKFPLSRASRRAFTLLELILALSLTVIVVLTITMAINLYWRQFDVRRTHVEEAQLARALLRHIADDLRSAMHYTPADLTGLSAVSQNSAAGAAAAAAGAALGGGDSDGDESGDGDATGQSGGGDGSSPMDGGGSPSGGNQDATATGGFTSGSDSMTTETGVAAATVGFYGSATELRLDVSRLPRVDQYEAMLVPDGSLGAVEVPSDVKTVTYFLRSEESADAADTPLGAATPIEGSLTGRGRGLMRREVDRAISTWAEQSGGATESSGQVRLLAEEVVSLSFQYFDGYQWLADCDSDQYGGLPLAVEILLVMSDADPDATDSPLQADTKADGSAPTERTYRLVVRLPTATIPTTDPAAVGTEAEDAQTLPQEPLQ